jgi:hypothetical protein
LLYWATTGSICRIRVNWTVSLLGLGTAFPWLPVRWKIMMHQIDRLASWNFFFLLWFSFLSPDTAGAVMKNLMRTLVRISEMYRCMKHFYCNKHNLSSWSQVYNLSTKELWKPTLDEDNSGSSKSSKHYFLLLHTYILGVAIYCCAWKIWRNQKHWM